MAKSKRTPETEKLILDAIRENGTDEYGWRAANIAKRTFYKWQTEDSHFMHKVAQAKQDYAINRAKTVKQKVKRNVEDYAINGTIEKWKTTETLKDAQGNIINQKEIEREINRPAPWAIDKITGKDINELDAIRKLVDSGFLKEEQLLAVEKILDEVTIKVKGILSGDIKSEEID